MFEKNQPGEKNEFLKLNVNVFQNKRNGQMMVTLPKKILKDIPKKLDIRIPFKYFKLKDKIERRKN